jgi:hypothetical protein
VWMPHRRKRGLPSNLPGERAGDRAGAGPVESIYTEGGAEGKESPEDRRYSDSKLAEDDHKPGTLSPGPHQSLSIAPTGRCPAVP